MSVRQTALSILIPTYNETDIIESALREIAIALKPDLAAQTEVIIVDDGTDSLLEVVARVSPSLPFAKVHTLRNTPGIGKGKSLAKGFEYAQSPIVGFLDVDLSTPPHYIVEAYASIASGEVSVFIGSRHIAGAKMTRKQFFLKDYLGNLLGVIARSIIFAGSRNYKDTQCGFKFYRAELTQALYKDLVAPDGLNDLEVLLRANILDLKVKEKGVVWTDLRESKRSLRRILWGEIKALIAILWHYKVMAIRRKRILKDLLASGAA